MFVMGLILSGLCLVVCFLGLLELEVPESIVAAAGVVAGFIGLSSSTILMCNLCYEVSSTTPVVEIGVPGERDTGKIVLIGDGAISVAYQPIMEELSQKPEAEKSNDE